MNSPLPTSHQALTVPKVMSALRMSRFKVYDLIRSKRLPSFTEGCLRRVPADAVATYMKNRLEEAA
ncbi:helix-turn-helix domain-containing protein [Streptomyces cinereospinus]|uniref:Helix-turn-helix domain-containing protein n=1 Tax=Streptomyces cinereospinus TaxID=285561 RepID=A0ABV5N5Y7_9ACTN